MSPTGYVFVGFHHLRQAPQAPSLPAWLIKQDQIEPPITLRSWPLLRANRYAATALSLCCAPETLSLRSLLRKPQYSDQIRLSVSVNAIYYVPSLITTSVLDVKCDSETNFKAKEYGKHEDRKNCGQIFCGRYTFAIS